MAFTNARDLIQLALIAASLRGGVSLEDIAETFGVSHRTAQRMTEAPTTTLATSPPGTAPTVGAAGGRRTRG
jgi:transposase